MKPRLSVPHTREDLAIWDRITERHDFQGIAYSAGAITADRRDADLMLQLLRRVNGWTPRAYSDPGNPS